MHAAPNISETITGPTGQDGGQPLIENLSTPDALLSRSEVMAALGFNYLTLYRRIKDGMPCYGRHRSARFKLSECLAWLAKQSGATNGKKKAQR